MTWAMAWAAAGEGRAGSGRNRPERQPRAARSAGLAAKRKIERLGETIRIASMGPLQDVAEALDPVPLESKIAPLREMAQAVEAARGGSRR